MTLRANQPGCPCCGSTCCICISLYIGDHFVFLPDPEEAVVLEVYSGETPIPLLYADDGRACLLNPETFPESNDCATAPGDYRVKVLDDGGATLISDETVTLHCGNNDLNISTTNNCCTDLDPAVTSLKVNVAAPTCFVGTYSGLTNAVNTLHNGEGWFWTIEQSGFIGEDSVTATISFWLRCALIGGEFHYILNWSAHFPGHSGLDFNMINNVATSVVCDPLSIVFSVPGCGTVTFHE